MWLSTFVLIHVSCATVGLLSGFLAMAFRKGSGLHRAAGSIFFVSMLSMSASAAYMAAFLRPNMINVVVGLLTFYLVATAWRAARRSEGGTDLFDLGALGWVLVVGVAGVAFGFEAAGSPTGSKDGMPAAAYFVFGSVALLCALSDARMFIRGGLFGVHRIARHLWRMCSALLIAALSFYPGQARLFPASLRETNLLMAPHLLLLGAMIFWMVRIRSRKREQHANVVVATHADVLPIGMSQTRKSDEVQRFQLNGGSKWIA